MRGREATGVLARRGLGERAVQGDEQVLADQVREQQSQPVENVGTERESQRRAARLSSQSGSTGRSCNLPGRKPAGAVGL